MLLQATCPTTSKSSCCRPQLRDDAPSSPCTPTPWRGFSSSCSRGTSSYRQHIAWSDWISMKGGAPLVRGRSWLSATWRRRASRASRRPSTCWHSNTTMSSQEHCQGSKHIGVNSACCQWPHSPRAR